jgi:hypothetical protein
MDIVSRMISHGTRFVASKVEVQSDRDPMTVVIELLVDDLLIFGLDSFQPDVPIGAVNGPMLVQKEL